MVNGSGDEYASTADSLKVIVYASKARRIDPISGEPDDLGSILTTSVRNNRKNGTTGILTFKNGYFLQVIEGHPNDIDHLWQKLSQDYRHENLTLLVDRPITERIFPDWRMKQCNADPSDDAFCRLIQHYLPDEDCVSVIARPMLRMFHDYTSPLKSGTG